MWFVVAAIVLLLGVVLFVARHISETAKGNYRDAEGTERPSWVAGNGRHGGV